MHPNESKARVKSWFSVGFTVSYLALPWIGVLGAYAGLTSIADVAQTKWPAIFVAPFVVKIYTNYFPSCNKSDSITGTQKVLIWIATLAFFAAAVMLILNPSRSMEDLLVVWILCIMPLVSTLYEYIMSKGP